METFPFSLDIKISSFSATGEGLAKVPPHFTSLVAIGLSWIVNTTNESISIRLANVATRLQDVNVKRCTKVTDDALLALATSCLLRRVELSRLKGQMMPSSP